MKAGWGNFNINVTRQSGDENRWRVSFVSGYFTSKEEAEALASVIRKEPPQKVRQAIMFNGYIDDRSVAEMLLPYRAGILIERLIGLAITEGRATKEQKLAQVISKGYCYELNYELACELLTEINLHSEVKNIRRERIS